jgi:hypothetical protein
MIIWLALAIPCDAEGFFFYLNTWKIRVYTPALSFPSAHEPFAAPAKLQAHTTAVICSILSITQQLAGKFFGDVTKSARARNADHVWKLPHTKSSKHSKRKHSSTTKETRGSCPTFSVKPSRPYRMTV